ncbi:MAG: NUDIX hydrolase [Desulfovibrio sp.]|jgi:8-oxo-dGTP diphosphatase|nr:NUDIX hydrolase [Desulfovibrio sp.]
MEKIITCPHCGRGFRQFANPVPTTDVVIYAPDFGVVIIERANAPHGFALPGGFINEGEQAEDAAVREMREETGLDVELTGLLGVYSHPLRDPRQHTLSVVFAGRPLNPERLRAGDDAKSAVFYPLYGLPCPLVFDHARIVRDFQDALAGRRAMSPMERHS